MKEILKIVEAPNIFKYLKKRQLLKQYKKAVKSLLDSNIKTIDFKIRQPKSNGIWSFRITKKYRVLGFFEDKNFVVFEIYDHQ